MDQTQYDVVVIGAGLAGLVAATRLAQRGRRVIVVESRDEPGGLCRAIELDGWRFSIGANDFGEGLTHMLEQLGVHVDVRPSMSRFSFDGWSVQLPPDAGTLLRLVPHALELARVVRRIRRADDDARVLEVAAPRHRRVADLLQLLPYALGAPDMLVHQLRGAFSKELGYGYQRSIVPSGGPTAIITALVQRLQSLRGELVLGARVEDATRDGSSYVVRGDGLELRARAVLSSEPRATEAAGMRPGLSCAAVLLVVGEGHSWPSGLHALGYMPTPFAPWLGALDRGEVPPRFGFHCFDGGGPARRGCRTLTALFFLPRGREDPGTDEREAHLRVLEDGLATIAPGLLDHVVHRRVIYPAEYRELVGAEPRPCRYVHEPGFRKPPSLDERTGIHHIGNSVQPPGEHAGGAALSGWRAAEAVDASLPPD